MIFNMSETNSGGSVSNTIQATVYNDGEEDVSFVHVGNGGLVFVPAELGIDVWNIDANSMVTCMPINSIEVYDNITGEIIETYNLIGEIYELDPTTACVFYVGNHDIEIYLQ